VIENILLVGFGEVGQAHFKVLKNAYYDRLFYKDKEDTIYDSYGHPCEEHPKQFDLLLIATQCDPANMEGFYGMVEDYDKQFNPQIIDILTTCPVGTCDELTRRMGAIICRSTTRGMHGKGVGIEFFLTKIPKHIGGPYAKELSALYGDAGIPCITHAQARAPELFHPLANSDYGIAIAKAQENYDLCRFYNVSYMEYLKYCQSNNDGFVEAGYPDKVKAILTPPMNSIGGHCVVYSANTFPREVRGPLMERLASYNERFNAPIKQDKN
jgi:hypothetical protein